MNKKLIIPLLLALPLTAFAKYTFDGTDTNGNSATGEPVADNVYEFNMYSKDAGANSDSNMLGLSSVAGQWWVGNSSGTPWTLYEAPENSNTHPSFHVTDDLAAGDSFFVGLSMKDQMIDYTSHFRITNNVLPSDTQVYFGLRNSDSSGNATPGVLLQDANGDPLRVVGGKNAPLHHISDETGLAFEGSSTGLEAPVHTPANTAGVDPNEFEWIHYQTTGAEDATFEIKLSGKDKKEAEGTAASLVITEWVAYFVIPEDATMADNVTPWTLDNTAWGDTVPSTTEAENDLVFSWTVDAKSGYGDGNPLYNTSNSVLTVPEPSSVLFLFSGVSLMLLRRKKSAA